MSDSTTYSLEAIVAALNTIPTDRTTEDKIRDSHSRFAHSLGDINAYPALLPKIALLFDSVVQLPHEQNDEGSATAVIVEAEKAMIYYVTKSRDDNGAKAQCFHDLWSAMQAVVKRASSADLKDDDPICDGLFLALYNYHSSKWFLDHLHSGWKDFQATASDLIQAPPSEKFKEKLSHLLTSIQVLLADSPPNLQTAIGAVRSLAQFYTDHSPDVQSISAPVAPRFDIFQYLRDASKPFNAVFTLNRVARNSDSQKIFGRPVSVEQVKLPTSLQQFSFPTSLSTWDTMLTDLVTQYSTDKLKQDFSNRVHGKHHGVDEKASCCFYSEVALLQWMHENKRMVSEKSCVAMSKAPCALSKIYYGKLRGQLENPGCLPALAWLPSVGDWDQQRPFPWSLPPSIKDDVKEDIIDELSYYLEAALRNAGFLVPMAQN